MKVVKLVAALFSLAALLSPLAVSAKTVEQAYVDSYAQAKANASETAPVPVAVVSPAAYVGNALVEVSFVVTPEGKPSDIAIRSSTDTELSEPVKEAIAQWKFSPARRNGEPVAQKVILPIRFVQAE